MKKRNEGIRFGIGLAGVLALSSAVHSMQQAQPLADRVGALELAPMSKKLTPKRFMLIGPDNEPTTDWITVRPGQAAAASNARLAGAAADCTSNTWMFDAGEFDPLTGDPVGGLDCGFASPSGRFWVGSGYQMPITVADVLVEPGTEGSMVSRVAFGFQWFVTGGVSSEQCWVVVLLFDDFDDTCALNPNGLPYDYLLGALVLDFGVVPSSDASYYSVDFNICELASPEAMFRAPLDGEGAVLFGLGNSFSGTLDSLTPPTAAQPVLWGTEPTRAGTNASDIEFQDDNPADGLFIDECYTLAGAGGICPGNAWDSDSVCTAISLGTLDAAGNVIPDGFDLLRDTGGGSINIPSIPADFFGPGSDPFTGTVPFEGETLDPGCGFVDTIIARPEAAIIPTPGVAPNDVSQDVQIELLALNLVSSSPITVTFGGVNPEQWDVAIDLGTQPLNTAVIQDNGGSGSITSIGFEIHPLFVFTRVSDQTELVFDPGFPSSTNLTGNWTATPPLNTPLGTEDNQFFLTTASIAGGPFSVNLANGQQTSTVPNDDCLAASPITAGVTPFDTSCASTDGPENPLGFCLDLDETQTWQDIWYEYTAPATGCDDCMVLVTTCDSLGGSAAYDSDLAMYFGTQCRPETMFQVACNDDAAMYPCGRDLFTSAMYVPVAPSQEYLIRVGGFGPGDAGTGNLNVQEVSVEPGFLSQPWNNVNGYASDVDPDTDQFMSDDFRLVETSLSGAGETIRRVRIHGSYAGGDGAPINGFTVMIQEDDGNQPGAVLDSQLIPAGNTTHVEVTTLAGGLTIWQIDLVLPLPVTLPAGRYWVSVFNDTTGDTDTFFWEAGDIDLPHAYFLGSLVFLDGAYQSVPADDLAIEVLDVCPGDTDGNQVIDVLDLLDVLGAWGPCDEPCPPNCAADVVPDCTVDVLDLLEVLGEWGECE